MPGFREIVAAGVALADSLTTTLQASVQHEAWEGNDGYGGDEFGAPVSRLAIVERKQELVRDAQGREVLSEHTITLLRPIADNGAPDREEPIDPRDRFTLPDGSTGPIITVKAFVDPVRGAGYFHQIYLGKSAV